MSIIDTVKQDPAAFMRDIAEKHNLSSGELAELHFKPQLDGFTMELVYQEGGGEGEGDYVERVIEVAADGDSAFVACTGFYDSYNGTEWANDWHLVEPRQVTMTKYFAVKS